jgi:hypothetical protein
MLTDPCLDLGAVKVVVFASRTFGRPVSEAAVIQVLTLPAVGRQRFDAALTLGVLAYREGYSDGFVDCLTIMGIRQ